MNLTHSCKQVAELLSQRLDEPLGMLDTIRLRVHLSLCGNCRNVEQQLGGVHELSRDLFANGLFGDDPGAETSPQLGNQRRLSQSDE
ncbi:MAG: zf-HC2 domain-containing protein [Burkholderiaceae bacterium]|nr:zf-HC2 domain-containing protein [Burkholderiaceae bacterium]